MLCPLIGTLTDLSDSRKFVIVIQEEAQVLISNIYLRVTPILAMLFLRLTTTRKAMPVDFVLDLVEGIVHKYTRVRVRCAHLGLRALQRGEETRVNECRFGIFEFLSDITCESEVGILVYRTGYEARDIRDISKDVRERV